MAEDSGSPVFADRYRFEEPVDGDWDHGSSGLTHLVYDLQEKHLRVIKRAEATSKQATDRLRNEVEALKALKGLGVPDLYETGHSIYSSNNYEYMVIEYIDVKRVKTNLGSLSTSERAEILTQLYGILTQAHQRRIVNGDIDLKHLFWREDKKKLVMIDWGYARLGVNPKRKTEFAFEMARSAEIIYSLVTNKGHPSATGQISLPDDAALISGLAPVPIEFRRLCKWAPRAPIKDAKAPHTASELFRVSKRWMDAVHSKKRYKPLHPIYNYLERGWRSMIAVLFIAMLTYFGSLKLISSLSTPSATSTFTSTEVSISVMPDVVVLTEAPSITPDTMKTSTPTGTLTPLTVPTMLVIDNNYSQGICWINSTNSLSSLSFDEGFTKRPNDDWWRFKIRTRSIEETVEADFNPCFEDQQLTAIGLNVWISRLEQEREAPLYEAGREFGFFIEDINSQRREYTISIDKENTIHLHIRENNNVFNDYKVIVVKPSNLRLEGVYPRKYNVFPIQFYLEINNQGLDILYLKEGPIQEPVETEDINSSKMIRIDNATRPTLANIKKFGLVGHGGETQTLIWPLFFVGK